MRLLVSGSPDPGSRNSRLLAAFARADLANEYVLASLIQDLPVFQPALDRSPWPEPVVRWRELVTAADAVIFCTPAYLHNLPGVLKNALDWLASSGELNAKPSLALTFTPAPPRGEKVIQSLSWSLEALNARVVLTANLHQSDATWNAAGELTGGEVLEYVHELLDQLAE